MPRTVNIEVMKTMFHKEIIEVKTIRMNVEPIYQILDEIESKGTCATHHSVITDEKSSINNKLLRDYILREQSIIFDEGDILIDGVGYTVVKNGAWTDYKKLPEIGRCRFCQLITRENGD